jgi:hypothetical protein
VAYSAPSGGAVNEGGAYIIGYFRHAGKLPACLKLGAFLHIAHIFKNLLIVCYNVDRRCIAHNIDSASPFGLAFFCASCFG